MSGPKFFVFKLKDLTIPVLVILIVIVLGIFFVYKNKISPTFAPQGFSNGTYVASINLNDADLDLIVNVENSNIVSLTLDGLDESDSLLYDDLKSSIDYVNTYVTQTQSLDLPENGKNSQATMILMEAIKVALSDNPNETRPLSVEKLELPADGESTAATTTDSEANNQVSDDDIFVDEFSDDDFQSTP